MINLPKRHTPKNRFYCINTFKNYLTLLFRVGLVKFRSGNVVESRISESNSRFLMLNLTRGESLFG